MSDEDASQKRPKFDHGFRQLLSRVVDKNIVGIRMRWGR